MAWSEMKQLQSRLYFQLICT